MDFVLPFPVEGIERLPFLITQPSAALYLRLNIRLLGFLTLDSTGNTLAPSHFRGCYKSHGGNVSFPSGRGQDRQPEYSYIWTIGPRIPWPPPSIQWRPPTSTSRNRATAHGIRCVNNRPLLLQTRYSSHRPLWRTRLLRPLSHGRYCPGYEVHG